MRLATFALLLSTQWQSSELHLLRYPPYSNPSPIFNSTITNPATAWTHFITGVSYIIWRSMVMGEALHPWEAETLNCPRFGISRSFPAFFTKNLRHFYHLFPLPSVCFRLFWWNRIPDGYTPHASFSWESSVTPSTQTRSWPKTTTLLDGPSCPCVSLLWKPTILGFYA